MEELLNIHKKNNNYKKSQSLVVGVGRKIEIEVNGKIQSWEVVDMGKSDIEKGKISFNAPLIQSIIGAKKGDKIKSKIMNRDFIIVIKKVSFLKNIREY